MSSPAEPLPSQVMSMVRNHAAAIGFDGVGGGTSSLAESTATTVDHGPWLPLRSTAATRTPTARPPSTLPKVSVVCVVGELIGSSQAPSGWSWSGKSSPRGPLVLTWVAPRYWNCTRYWATSPVIAPPPWCAAG
jgi:hypothetical protein